VWRRGCLVRIARPSSGRNQKNGVESISHFREDELEVPDKAALVKAAGLHSRAFDRSRSGDV